MGENDNITITVKCASCLSVSSKEELYFRFEKVPAGEAELHNAVDAGGATGTKQLPALNSAKAVAPRGIIEPSASHVIKGMLSKNVKLSSFHKLFNEIPITVCDICTKPHKLDFGLFSDITINKALKKKCCSCHCFYQPAEHQR